MSPNSGHQAEPQEEDALIPVRRKSDIRRIEKKRKIKKLSKTDVEEEEEKKKERQIALS